jgi:hypothetical protein
MKSLFGKRTGERSEMRALLTSWGDQEPMIFVLGIFKGSHNLRRISDRVAGNALSSTGIGQVIETAIDPGEAVYVEGVLKTGPYDYTLVIDASRR